MVRLRPAFGLLAAILLGLACAGEPETPEAQVRARLAEMEAAAEAGDLGAFKDLVSEGYQDPLGHDKTSLVGYLRLHVIANQRGREVLLRLRDLQIVEPGRAAVSAHVGLAGSGAEALVQGNVYALEVDLEREADDVWRVTWADWRPAAPAELL